MKTKEKTMLEDDEDDTYAWSGGYKHGFKGYEMMDLSGRSLETQELYANGYKEGQQDALKETDDV